jgi:hypothetical protein
MKQQVLLWKVFFILFILCPLTDYAQKDTAKILIPMKNGIINYEITNNINNQLNKAELYNRAIKWFAKTFPIQEKGTKVFDKAAGKISGPGIFKVVTSNSGNYYWLRFKVSIVVSDSNYIFRTSDYYEKPVESGITNDYSKIEYRWWDFRQGHPWSAEDKTLFEGLDTNTLSVIKSFKTEMDK